jgi:hypothetical protein
VENKAGTPASKDLGPPSIASKPFHFLFFMPDYPFLIQTDLGIEPGRFKAGVLLGSIRKILSEADHRMR